MQGDMPTTSKHNTNHYIGCLVGEEKKKVGIIFFKH